MRLKLGNFFPTQWSPLLFVDYLQGITEDVGEMTKWKDLSTNATDIDEVIGSDGPVLETDGVLFNTSSILRTSQNIDFNVDGTPFSINIIISTDVAGVGFARNIVTLVSKTLFRNGTSNRENISLLKESIFPGTERNYDEFYNITLTYDGTTFFIYRDGDLVYSKITGIDADAVTGLLTLGTTAGDYSFKLKGLILFNEYLVASKVEILSGWSAHYYNMTDKLHVDHKYKDVSP